MFPPRHRFSVLALAVLLILFAATQASGCGAAPDPDGRAGVAKPVAGGTDASLQVYEDDTARLRGEIMENVRMCEIDAACWLVFRVEGESYRVVYEAEEGGSCPNRKAANVGYAAEPGDRLEVYGGHNPAPRGGTISTCPEERFYIRAADG